MNAFSRMCIAPVWLAVLMSCAGCRDKGRDSYQGYIEGEYVYASVPLAGSLERLEVARGDQVTGETRLFVLEHGAETAEVAGAGAGVKEAEALLEDLRKGKRPSEMAALDAQLEEAKSRLALAEIQLARRRKLAEANPGALPREELDRFAMEVDAEKARVAGLVAALETARLGARPDAIAAAEDKVAAQRALLEKAEWALRQKTALSPAEGMVQDTLYRAGEWVAAGKPVVVLLPPENVKVRFFVPQPRLAGIRVGQKIAVRFDGAPRAYEGRVNFISTRAEFTPPVIYSEERRAKLVFMVEGEFAPADARDLKPGQPVEVFPETPPPAP